LSSSRMTTRSLCKHFPQRNIFFSLLDFGKEKRCQWKSGNDCSIRALQSNIVLLAFTASSGTNFFFSLIWVNQPFRDLTIESHKRLMCNPGFHLLICSENYITIYQAEPYYHAIYTLLHRRGYQWFKMRRLHCES